MTCVADGFERGLVVARGADAAAARQLADEVIAGLGVEIRPVQNPVQDAVPDTVPDAVGPRGAMQR